MVRTLLVGAALLACLTALSDAVSAQASAKPIIVAVENLDYFPHYRFNDGRSTGFGPELVQAFFAEKGYKAEFHPIPVSRHFQVLADGEADLKYPDNPNWDQDAKRRYRLVYSRPVVAFTDGVLVLPERRGKGLGLLRQLGTVRGFTPVAYLPYVKESEVSIQPRNSVADLIKAVLSGRLDGIYMNVDVAAHYLSNELRHPSALEFDPGLPHDRNFYFLSTIRHPDLIREFDRFLADEENGLVARLKQRYGLK